MATIRGYRPDDLSAVYDICVRTGDAGGDARGQHSSDRLLGDCFAAPYVTLEPQSAFVLEDSGQVVGYILGTADTGAFVERYTRSWLPYLRERYPEPHAEADRHLLTMGLHPERMIDPALAQYPAHLHIDLLPQTQGQGFGRALMNRFLQAMHEAGAPAVHLGMAASNTGARAFYERMGFHSLAVGEPGTHMGRSTAS